MAMTDVELFGWQRRIAAADTDELRDIIDEMEDPEAKVFSARDPAQMEHLARISLLLNTERQLASPPSASNSDGRDCSHDEDRGDRHTETRTVDLSEYYNAKRIEDEYAQFRADLETVRDMAMRRLEHIRYRQSVRYRPAPKSPLQNYIEELQ